VWKLVFAVWVAVFMNNHFFPSSVCKENAYAPGECRLKDLVVAASTTIGEWAWQKANSVDDILVSFCFGDIYLQAGVGILGRTSKRLRAIKGQKEGMLDVSPQLSHFDLRLVVRTIQR
jgi:hypothetical protein